MQLKHNAWSHAFKRTGLLAMFLHFKQIHNSICGLFCLFKYCIEICGIASSGVSLPSDSIKVCVLILECFGGRPPLAFPFLFGFLPHFWALYNLWHTLGGTNFRGY